MKSRAAAHSSSKDRHDMWAVIHIQLPLAQQVSGRATALVEFLSRAPPSGDSPVAAVPRQITRHAHNSHLEKVRPARRWRETSGPAWLSAR
jgi:hypothetical protein